MKKTFIAILSVLFVLSACKDDNDTPGLPDPPPIEIIEKGTFVIEFDGTSAEIKGDEMEGVTITADNANVNVVATAEGIKYSLTGTSTNGSLTIDSSQPFEIVLDDVNLTKQDAPAIYLLSAQASILTVKDETTNTLIDGSIYSNVDEDMEGCISSNGQIEMKGKGTLNITGNYKHAISSDSYIVIKDTCTINIPSSAADGIHATNHIEIYCGTFNMTTANEGIESKNGKITIHTGDFAITTTGQKSDGIKCADNLLIKDGNFGITTQGAASKAIKSNKDFTIEGGTFSLETKGDAISELEDGDTSSSQGIKSYNLTITNDKTDITISSTGKGGKGISCDNQLIINNGNITVTATGDRFVDGTLTSSAKGIRCKGDITINGGVISSYSETSDGIDCDYKITINDGTITSIGGPADEGFNCLKNSFYVNGGTVVGIGGSTNKPVNSSKQKSLVYTANWKKDQTVMLNNSANASLLKQQITKAYAPLTLLFSSSELVSGQYSIYADETLMKSFDIKTSTVTEVN